MSREESGEHATTFENCRLTRMIWFALLIPSKYWRWATLVSRSLGGTIESGLSRLEPERTTSAPLLPSARIDEVFCKPLRLGLQADENRDAEHHAAQAEQQSPLTMTSANRSAM